MFAENIVHYFNLIARWIVETSMHSLTSMEFFYVLSAYGDSKPLQKLNNCLDDSSILCYLTYSAFLTTLWVYPMRVEYRAQTRQLVAKLPDIFGS